MIGAGKYDDLCTIVREKSGAKSGVIVAIVDGNKGTGFSVQGNIEFLSKLPEVLESLAKQIRDDITAKGKMQ